jgi:hypothetical protein
MSRFMLALLGDGSLESGRLLSPASVATLLAAQYTPDPRIAPRGHAFKHWVTHRDGARNAQRVAGTYRDYRHARDDLTRLMALMPMIQSRVTVDADGGFTGGGIAGSRWNRSSSAAPMPRTTGRTVRTTSCSVKTRVAPSPSSTPGAPPMSGSDGRSRRRSI